MTTPQRDEVAGLVDQGVSSFKFYMFYKGLNLAADSTRGKDYIMAEDSALGHLYELMVRVAEDARRRRIRISLSLHCENSELIRVFIARAKKEGWTGLEAYSKGRPQLTQSLSIEEAAVLAGATGCPSILLHISRQGAMQ